VAHDAIAILDFGSQYTQLIARRVREAHVYCELFPWDASPEEVLALEPRGFILSGGPFSVYAPRAPRLPDHVLTRGIPVLGICYGMQLLAHRLGGRVAPAAKREYGPAEVESVGPDSPLLGNLKSQNLKVWMSHGDRIEALPPGFEVLACSANSPVAAMGDLARELYGLQFHPEVAHTDEGGEILRRFAVEVCGCTPIGHRRRSLNRRWRRSTLEWEQAGSCAGSAAASTPRWQRRCCTMPWAIN